MDSVCYSARSTVSPPIVRRGKQVAVHTKKFQNKYVQNYLEFCSILVLQIEFKNSDKVLGIILFYIVSTDIK